jgi:hypothetical protein
MVGNNGKHIVTLDAGYLHSYSVSPEGVIGAQVAEICRCSRPKCHLVTKAGSRSAWNGRLYIVILGCESDYTPSGSVVFNSAQPVCEYSSILVFGLPDGA